MTLEQMIDAANAYVKSKGIDDAEVISGLYDRIVLNQENVTKENVYACLKQWVQHSEIDLYRKKNRIKQPDITYSEDQLLYNGQLQNETTATEKENAFIEMVANIKSILTKKQAIAFEEFYVNEKSIKEIAHELNWSESSVKATINAGRIKIRELYGKK